MSWQLDASGNDANEDYWGPKVVIKEIVFKKVGEDAGRVAGLLAGQGDVINNLPVDDYPSRKGSPGACREGDRFECIFWRCT